MSEQRAQGMVNTVNVFSIDEERLRFRVIVAIKGVGNYEGRGTYQVDFPIPTSFTNSHEYSNCLMKCDSFTASALFGIADASWGRGPQPPAPARGVKIPALELRMSVPTSQVAKSSILGVAAGNPQEVIPTDTEMSTWAQLLPGQVINTGNGVSFGVGATSADKGWMSISGRAENPIMCGNPFGQQVRITFRDPITENDVYLQDCGGGGGNMGPEQGQYVMQFDITMIPN
tara:strand:+ start:6314 stop:7003 length:690 start_codon:yes stop_codon:yes gene_type:complete